MLRRCITKFFSFIQYSYIHSKQSNNNSQNQSIATIRQVPKNKRTTRPDSHCDM